MTTGKLPESMYVEGIRSALEHPIEKAYGLVFDAIEHLNKRTRKSDEKGLALLKEAIMLDPYNETALFMLCDILLSGEGALNAVQYVDKLLSIMPNDPIVYLWKGQTLILQDKELSGSNLEKAAGYAKKAYAIDPENFDVLAFCAQTSYWIEDPNHDQYVREMYKLDWRRADRFMKEYFIYLIPRNKR